MDLKIGDGHFWDLPDTEFGSPGALLQALDGLASLLQSQVATADSGTDPTLTRA